MYILTCAYISLLGRGLVYSGPRKTGTEYNRPRPNREIYAHVENIIHTMRKTRLSFLGNLNRMNNDRLPKQIFNKILNLKVQLSWFTQILNDLKEANIAIKDTHNRDLFRDKIQKIMFREEQERKRKQPCNIEQLRKLRSERMKQIWAERRKRLSVN